MRTIKSVLVPVIIVMFCMGLPGITRADSGPIYFSVGMLVPPSRRPAFLIRRRRVAAS
ncbi:MAG: hypothetical protein ABFD13_02190 [Candidatus Cryosericum sp.]|nr:hypothetical protein [bacterium]